jgi:hypothetical protein
LWDRFQKSVRVGVDSDDIRSDVFLPQKYVLSPLMWCLGQPSNAYQSNCISEYCQNIWSIWRGVKNTQQAPPKNSIEFLTL